MNRGTIDVYRHRRYRYRRRHRHSRLHSGRLRPQVLSNLGHRRRISSIPFNLGRSTPLADQSTPPPPLPPIASRSASHSSDTNKTKEAEETECSRQGSPDRLPRAPSLPLAATPRPTHGADTAADTNAHRPGAVVLFPFFPTNVSLWRLTLIRIESSS